MTASPALSIPYAGDISPAEAWRRLGDDPHAWLVDVRTQAEWTFVGVPDLPPPRHPLVRVCWQIFPSMAPNDDFAADIEAAGIRPDDTVLLICRSGARSRAAAEFLTMAGFRSCWNVRDGFEGDPDASRHRGTVAGWKASGLPWVQG